MTNWEKFKEIFGIPQDIPVKPHKHLGICFIVDCSTQPSCEDCPINPVNHKLIDDNFWGQEYKESEVIGDAEVIETLRFLHMNTTDDVVEEALEMAIEAFSVEPCEDCVSREAGVKAIKELSEYHTGDAFNKDRVIRTLRNLPSVTSQTKRGHWIKQADGTYKCSNCKKYELWEGIYCASCGAKMIVEKEKCVTCIYNGQIDDECAYCTNHHLYKESEG